MRVAWGFPLYALLFPNEPFDRLKPGTSRDRGDVTWQPIETNNRPAISDRAIAVERRKPCPSGRIEIKLQPIEVVAKALTECLYDRLLVRPQRVEHVLTA